MRSLGDIVEELAKHAEIKTSPRQLFTYVPFPEDLRKKFEDVAKHVVPQGKASREIDHCTLLYIPKAEADVAQERIDKILKTMRDVCSDTKPIHAKVQGWAYFDGAEEDGVKKTALVALLDAPGLEDLHGELKAAMRGLGLNDAGTHIFTPHVTFAYLDLGERVKDLPLLYGEFDIDKVMFANADKHALPLLGHKSLGQKAANAVEQERDDRSQARGQVLRGLAGVTGNLLAGGVLAGTVARLDRASPQVTGAAAQGAAVLRHARRQGVEGHLHVLSGVPTADPRLSVMAAGYGHRQMPGMPKSPIPFTGQIRLPNSVSEGLIAHEVGHARNYHHTGNTGYVATRLPGMLSQYTAFPAIAYAAGAKDPLYTPALAHAALGLPTLIDEGLASGRAVASLVGQHGLGQGLRRSLPLIPAFGTYALSTLGPLALTALRKHMNRPPEVKEAAWAQKAAASSKMRRLEVIPKDLQVLSQKAYALSAKANTRDEHIEAMNAHYEVGKRALAQKFDDFGDEHKGQAHDHWVAKSSMKATKKTAAEPIGSGIRDGRGYSLNTKEAAWAQHAALNLGQAVGGHGNLRDNLLYAALPPSLSGHNDADIQDLDRSNSLRDWFDFGYKKDAPHPGDIAEGKPFSLSTSELRQEPRELPGYKPGGGTADAGGTGGVVDSKVTREELPTAVKTRLDAALSKGL